ncbi:MAG: hypothetical protein DRH32_03010 [Deltaproteobacteria bacterium]|nr:MAG: hypothetical protein DRH32_03010 [Deltaproteobacteria bacterium]
MEIIYTPGMITINATMVIELVSFLILVVVLNRIMFRPLLDTIKIRNERIASLSGAIESNKSEAEKIMLRLREHEQLAKKEAFERKKELENLGTRKATEILEAAKKEITSIKEDVDREIEAQLKQAKESFKKDSETIASEIIEHILGRSSAVS